MQEKRNIQLLILFGVLSITTAVVYWMGQRTNGFAVDKEIFKVTELENIDEVTLASGNEKVVLKFDGTRWMVNEHVADRNMIDVLFATLAQAEPKRPLASSLRDSVSNTLRTNGIHVSLISEGKVMKNFYAGGNTQKTQAYFLGADAIPYYMLIPGYRVYVSGIFELGENDWRDKYVFGFNWQNFKTMKVSFPDQPQQDFEVSKENNLFGIEGIKTDTTRLSNFLERVYLLTVDRHILEPVSLEEKPIMDISIFALGNLEYKISLFQQEGNREYRGLINGKSNAIFSTQKISPLLRGKDYYILTEDQ